MQRIAAEVDYAETAFITGERDGARVVRYFSPVAEVPFCGHATVAAAIAIAEREGPGTVRFATPVGEVAIETTESDGALRAAFTSVDTDTRPMPGHVLDALLDLIGVDRGDLDERHPPLLAYGGNWHPILVIEDADAFDGFGFDPAVARSLMDEHGWPATITVVRRLRGAAEEADGGLRLEARNIFPVGRITEDPATGAAAAATGAVPARPGRGRAAGPRGDRAGAPCRPSGRARRRHPRARRHRVSGRAVPIA